MKTEKQQNTLWIKVSGSMIKVDSIVEFNPMGFIYTSNGRCHILNNREIRQVYRAIKFLKP